jgi:hypothetical protein
MILRIREIYEIPVSTLLFANLHASKYQVHNALCILVL